MSGTDIADTKPGTDVACYRLPTRCPVLKPRMLLPDPHSGGARRVGHGQVCVGVQGACSAKSITLNACSDTNCTESRLSGVDLGAHPTWACPVLTWLAMRGTGISERCAVLAYLVGYVSMSGTDMERHVTRMGTTRKSRKESFSARAKIASRVRST